MTKLGYRSYIGFADQTTFTTAVQPTTYIEYSSEGFKKTKDEILIDAVNGTAQYKKRVTGQETIEGSLEFPVVPGSTLKLLKNFLGSATTSTLTTGVYQHIFVARASSLDNPGLTFQVCRDTSDSLSSINYFGCKINTASFAMNVNGLLTCSLNLMGKDESYANTVSTASYRTFNPYNFKDASIKIGDTSAAATTTSVESWKIDINNNIVETRALGSATRVNLDNGIQDITYEITNNFDNNNEYNRFINGTKTYISAQFSGVSITAVYNHSIKFESWNCYFNGNIGNIGSAKDIVKSTYPIRAIFEDSSVSSLKVTVVTDVASV